MKGAIRLHNPTRIAILQQYNKLVVHSDQGLMTYSLDLLARVWHQDSSGHMLEASMERITPREENILFFRTGFIAERMIGE